MMAVFVHYMMQGEYYSQIDSKLIMEILPELKGEDGKANQVVAHGRFGAPFVPHSAPKRQ